MLRDRWGGCEIDSIGMSCIGWGTLEGNIIRVGIEI